MTEQEEFEFRARAEAERAASINPDAIREPVGTSSALPMTTGSEFGRQGGLLTRAVANTVASPLTLGGNAIGKALNVPIRAMGGPEEYFKPSTDILNRGLTTAGLPQPETGVEKFTQDIARNAPAFAIPGGLGPQVLGNAALGAADAPAGSELEGGMWGAAGGGLGQTIGKLLSRGIPGISKEARQLMDTTDIQPTVGMAVPKLKAMEEFMTGVPLVGEFAKGSRQRAINEFSDAAIAKAVPGAPKVSGSPFEKLDAANDYVSSIYHDVLPKVGPEVPRPPVGNQLTPSPGVSAQSFADGYAAARQNNYLSAPQLDVLDRVYNNHADKISTYSGEQLKMLDSELGEQIRRFQRSPTTAGLADSLQQIQLGLRTGIEARLPAAEQGRLASANKSYRELIALNDAASKSTETVVTPRQLTKSLALRDKTPGTRLRGELPEFARDAAHIIPNVAGTRGYSSPGLAGAILGTGAATFTGHLPTLAVASGAAGLGSTRTGQALLTGNTALQRLFAARAAERLRLLPASGAAMFNPNEEQ